MQAQDETKNQPEDACDDPAIVEHMVHYFYHLTYTTESETAGGAASEMLDHAAIFAMAIKYQVPGLRTIAAQKFRVALNTHKDDHASLAKTISIVLKSTHDDVLDLRDPLTETLLDQHEKLLKVPEILDVAFKGTVYINRLMERLGERCRSS